MMYLSNFNWSLILVLTLGMILTSCSKEMEDEDYEESELNAQDGNSGYGDDEDCFELNFPLDVQFPDGTQTSFDDEEMLEDAIEVWFETSSDTVNFPTFIYPIDVTLSDQSTQTLNNAADLDALLNSCGEEHPLREEEEDYDDDEEEEGDDEDDCIELVYPVEILFPDGSTQTANDYDMEEQIEEAWEEQNPDMADEINYVYPVEVILPDGTITNVNSYEELETLEDEQCS